MKLGALRREDMPYLLNWRNQSPESWRDPRPTTITQQYEWFDGPVSHSPNARYWGVFDEDQFIGQTEITSIIWESRIGEIGAIVNPSKLRKGAGTESVRLTLIEARDTLNLKTVFGECYLCNLSWHFWSRLVEKWHGQSVPLPNRKFWQGQFYDSLYFSWDLEEICCLDS
jgi:RimJ/RimL family protein N-acetyltransferase